MACAADAGTFALGMLPGAVLVLALAAIRRAKRYHGTLGKPLGRGRP